MPRTRLSIGLILAAGVAVLAGGCMHGAHGEFAGGPGHAPRDGMPAVAVPPPGAVPRELDKITLPPYVIEAPDQLLIEVVYRTQVPELDRDGKELVPRKMVDATIPLPTQPVSGSFQVRLDGSVGLGFWGSVPVSGLTLDQAADSIRNHLLKQDSLAKFKVKPESVFVIVDVIAYNSKRYYIITDGGGFGEQVVSFPITGSETVLDAMSNVGGLSEVSSKRNVWVARRTPHPGQPWQILPVDWVGITQHGVTYTNYQIMPGDRIYVKAQRLVTIDRTLARVLSPIERVFGVTLLGSNTVNNIAGRGLGFGGTN